MLYFNMSTLSVMNIPKNKKITVKQIREWNGKHLDKGKCPNEANNYLSYDGDCLLCRLIMQLSLMQTTDKN